MGTSSERAFGMALTSGDLGRDRESSLANGYLYRFGPFAWLDRAFAKHNDGLIHTKVDALLKCLHNDPRFAALLKRLNLPT
jgi:hypothetical protein